MTDLTNPNYKPGNLLDVVLDKLDRKNDRALSKVLDIKPTTISKLRNRKASFSAAMLIALGEAVDLTVGQLRELAGLPRRMYIRG